MADTFIEALYTLESSKDVEPLAALYAENSEIGNLIAPEKFTGPQGARDFWTKYRETFGELKSEFRNKIASEGRVALEWTTTGSTTEGQTFSYDGVSILELEGDKITRFRAYFDPHYLGKQVEPADIKEQTSH